MKAALSSQMRKIDSDAVRIYGIPGVLLMENAAIKLCYHIVDVEKYKNEKICIVCGKGNNGGDGFAAARHLALSGRSVIIYLIGAGKDLKGDALTNYIIDKNMGIEIYEVRSMDGLNLLKKDIKGSGIVVDGLLGTGIKGEVKGLYKDIIDIINENARFVVSIDIPSGVDADTGKVSGTAVLADRTVTFALPKIGLYTFPGADHAGRVYIEDISMPHELIERQNINTGILTESDISNVFLPRKRDSNKGTYGRALIIGGSENMMGAPVMSILSALRCGAGLVEACVPSSIQQRVAPLAVEAIVKGVKDEDGIICSNALDEILDSLKHASSYAIGPGLTASERLLDILSNVIEEADVPGVIDADGLNVLSLDKSILKESKSQIIITPHPGEMARLLKSSIKDIQSDRIGCAREFSSEFGAITVLKGANTVIASPNGEVFINTTGNPGMAKGGSGDILTGMIASLLAQGIEPYEACKAGVFVHGRAGDIALQHRGEYGMKARDIIDSIPDAILSINCKSID